MRQQGMGGTLVYWGTHAVLLWADSPPDLVLTLPFPPALRLQLPVSTFICFHLGFRPMGNSDRSLESRRKKPG